VERIILAPIGIVAGLIAGMVAQKLFDFIWSRVSEEEAPEPDQREISWPLLVVALLVEGAIFRLVKGLVERGTRSGYQRMTGTWPGEERPEPT
jgi:Protein of unknown function (DUF4235)